MQTATMKSQGTADVICVRQGAAEDGVRFPYAEARRSPTPSQATLIRYWHWMQLRKKGWTTSAIASVYRTHKRTVEKGITEARLLKESLDDLDLPSGWY